MRDYELTDDEHTTLLEALEYAEENAVHRQSRAKFINLKQILIQQYEEQEGRKATE